MLRYVGAHAVRFDAEAHVYRVDGEVWPSVTEVIGGPDYSWVSSEVLEEASWRGSHVHRAVERTLRDGEPVDFVASGWQGYYQSFLKWWEFLSPEVYLVEHLVVDPVVRVCGTLDLFCRISDSARIIDFKTRSSDRSDGHQLGGYLSGLMSDPAAQDIAGRVDPDTVELWGVYLRNNGKPAKQIKYPASLSLINYRALAAKNRQKALDERSRDHG